MKCPRCETLDLLMTERVGVEIDYCPQCRGVWLDRGELDKIISISSDDDDHDDDWKREYKEKFKQEGYQLERRHHDDDDDHDHEHHGHKKHRKRGFMHYISEIFDF